MAIIVGHSTSAGAVAGAAFAGAQGQARQRIAAEGRRAAERDRARAIRVAEQERQRQFTLARDLQGQQFRQENMLLNAGIQGRLAEDAFARRELGADAESARRRADLEYSLTTRQRMELDQLADAEAEAMRSPDFTDEEKAELRRRFAARRAGVRPVERPREPTAAERFRENTIRDPETGVIFALDQNGLPGRPIFEPPPREPSYQDRIKAFQAATAIASDETGRVDDARLRQALQMMGLGPEQMAPPVEAGADRDSMSGQLLPSSPRPALPTSQPAAITQARVNVDQQVATIQNDFRLIDEELNRLQIEASRRAGRRSPLASGVGGTSSSGLTTRQAFDGNPEVRALKERRKKLEEQMARLRGLKMMMGR